MKKKDGTNKRLVRTKKRFFETILSPNKQTQKHKNIIRQRF